MTNRKLKQLMNGLNEKISFDKDWSLKLKSEMMLNFAEEKEASKIGGSLRWSRLVSKLVNVLAPQQLAMKPVATFSLILGLFVISGFASVNASRNSLPGDTLYPLKLTAENLKYSLSFSSESKAKVAMDRIEERMSELKTLADSMSVDGNKQKMVKTATEIKNNLNLVTSKIQAIGSDVDESEIKTAKEIDNKLVVMKSNLETVSQTMGSELDSEITALKEQVEKASALTVATINSEVNKNVVTENSNIEATTTDLIELLPTNNITNKDLSIVNNTSSEETFIKDLIVEKEAPKEEFRVKVGE